MKKEVKINSEGRIVIPADIRKTLNIKDDDILIIELTETGEMKLEPKEDRCGICNKTATTNNHLNAIQLDANKLTLCDECINQLIQILI